MKTLIVHYSHTGNNKYLAERIALKLNGDVEEIKPKWDIHPSLLFSSLTKLSLGIKPLKHNVKTYDQMIVCGPIWAGKLISPLRSVLKRYRDQIGHIHFATCCGSTDEMKNKTFGYGSVFKSVKRLLGNRNVTCEAFPIPLVLAEEDKENDELIMKTKLSDENFTGEIQKRLDKFIQNLPVKMMSI